MASSTPLSLLYLWFLFTPLPPLCQNSLRVSGLVVREAEAGDLSAEANKVDCQRCRDYEHPLVTEYLLLMAYPPLRVRCEMDGLGLQ